MNEIICADAQDWLAQQKTIPNVVTGICDMDEMPGYDIDRYLQFFSKVVNLIFEKLQDGCYAIFIQTDRKYDRRLIDKSYIITDIARQHGIKMIWHKIVLHRDVDATDLYRPTYAHMLCYSRNGTTGAATPDVIPVSKKGYKNATPPEAAKRALAFVKKNSKVNTVVDPFVGRGTIPLLARELGLNTVGIDIDPEQCDITRRLLDA
jgi:DNA modification methylase